MADVRGERPRPLSLLQRVRAGDGRARRRPDREHRERRRLSAAARDQPTAYGASKAAVHRFSELLAADLAPKNVFVFSISPGLVKTEMTKRFPDDAPWTPPDCAPRLVLALASGELDALAGRYLHAEHDPPESLRERVDEILEQDLNAIRLRR